MPITPAALEATRNAFRLAESARLRHVTAGRCLEAAGLARVCGRAPCVHYREALDRLASLEVQLLELWTANR